MLLQEMTAPKSKESSYMQRPKSGIHHLTEGIFSVEIHRLIDGLL
jgi:hypothetical protein